LCIFFAKKRKEVLAMSQKGISGSAKKGISALVEFPYQTIAKFRDKEDGSICFVKQGDEKGSLMCTCRSWVLDKKCKHIEYIKAHPFVQLISVPTYQESVSFMWGQDKKAKDNWVIMHLKVIEI